MKVEKIAQLIEIRNYVVNAVHNFNLNREDSREMGKMLTLLDKHITGAILDSNFKKLINFEEEADKALAEARENNSGAFTQANLKKDMPVKQSVAVIPDGGLLLK